MVGDSGAEPLLSYQTSREKSAEIIKQINSTNAKLVACALVFGFILYHGVVHIRYGRFLGLRLGFSYVSSSTRLNLATHSLLLV
jgi:hypothetical protein